mmetsp:Transcript_14332/g.45886  ORF Transcript_14332/g.45886 Transcript_14332/m.45886 type:complete len:297 (-) Transcript_14332:462-1352(-)
MPLAEDATCPRERGGDRFVQRAGAAAHAYMGPSRAPSSNRHRRLDEIGHVHGHLVDLCVVELLDFPERADVLSREEVDGNALAAEAAAPTNAVDVVLAVRGQVVVDHQRHLLHVDAASQHIRRDEHSAAARAEVAHDELALLLVEVSMDRRAREVAVVHLPREPLDLAAGVDEDHRLGDGESLVEVAQRVELPLLTLNHHIELLDTVQGQLVALDEDADRIAHELRGELQHIGGHGGREKADVHGRRELLEHVVDLVLEASREHLIGLVQHEVMNVVDTECASVDHVEHSAGSAHD